MILEAGEAILAAWAEEEAGVEERQIVFDALAHIAARPSLPPRGTRVQRFRRTVVDRLLDELRDEGLWTRPLLARLQEAPGLGVALRREIASRLAEVFAVARAPDRGARA